MSEASQGEQSEPSACEGKTDREVLSYRCGKLTSSDEESVNVGLLGEARSGCTGSRSSIKDTGVLGNVGSGNLAEVLPAVGMGLLGLLRGGGESSADGPDGLVSNDNPFPVLLGKCISVSLELREDEVVGGSSLTVL